MMCMGMYSKRVLHSECTNTRVLYRMKALSEHGLWEVLSDSYGLAVYCTFQRQGMVHSTCTIAWWGVGMVWISRRERGRGGEREGRTEGGRGGGREGGRGGGREEGEEGGRGGEREEGEEGGREGRRG